MTDNDWGVRVESLRKLYRITPAGQRLSMRRRELLWALRDVSFEVPRASTLGVIGRNGAGKTTLLKILARVTSPTAGRVLLAGRVGALLEVGTGFHPELTGRENVELNGAILGMRRREIASKFDEIVEFAEMERFIDTPVKRYSSGMSLRLAFSVAAHLEPDVLVIDEVLAVGDASFQAKCLGKMDEVTGQGRTVVLVSHSMPTIASLADRCIWLDGGQIVADGTPAEVIEEYVVSARSITFGSEVDLGKRDRAETQRVELQFATVRVVDSDGSPRAVFFEREPIEVQVEIEVGKPVRWLELRAYVKTIHGVWLFAANSGKNPVELEPGRYLVSTHIDPNYLRPGHYSIDLGMQSSVPQDHVVDAIRFEVSHALEGDDDPSWRSEMGLMRFGYDWSQPKPISPGIHSL